MAIGIWNGFVSGSNAMNEKNVHILYVCNLMRNEMKNKFVLTVSYADYAQSTGGTDRTILAQQGVLNDHEISDVHIFPLRHVWKMQNRHGYIWGMCIDGVFCRYMETAHIIQYLAELVQSGYQFGGIIIHHLMNVNLRELSRITDAVSGKIIMYIHDYMTICPRAGLVDGNNCYCGSGFPSTEKCRNCVFYTNELTTRSLEIINFLRTREERMTFAFPSDTAREICCESFELFKPKAEVIYHQLQVGTYLGNCMPIATGEAVRIAFVGYQSPIKGWKEWQEAAQTAHLKGCNYELYQFGRCKDHIPYVKEINIDFRNSLDEMTNQLRRHEIHVAVLWSIVPETYSYTYYEAMASNCFVLTNSKSGNISDQVRKRGNGFCADNPDGLTDILLDEKKLREMVNSYRENGVKGPLYVKENDQIVEMLDFNHEVFGENMPLQCNHKAEIVKWNVLETIWRLLKKIKGGIG